MQAARFFLAVLILASAGKQSVLLLPAVMDSTRAGPKGDGSRSRDARADPHAGHHRPAHG